MELLRCMGVYKMNKLVVCILRIDVLCYQSQRDNNIWVSLTSCNCPFFWQKPKKKNPLFFFYCFFTKQKKMKFVYYGLSLCLFTLSEYLIRRYHYGQKFRFLTNMIVSGCFGINSVTTITFYICSLSQLFPNWKPHKHILIHSLLPFLAAQIFLLQDFEPKQTLVLCGFYFVQSY